MLLVAAVPPAGCESGFLDTGGIVDEVQVEQRLENLLSFPWRYFAFCPNSSWS